MTTDDQKRLAAERAIDLVEEGMRLGLGTGSTAAHFVRLLGERVKNGLSVAGVPTSRQTEELAKQCGIPLSSLGELGALDLAVDGADEVDGAFNLIKGAGGALLREKIVAAASERVVILVDENKIVRTLGAFLLPVEIAPFGARVTEEKIRNAAEPYSGGAPTTALRSDNFGEPFVTDGDHFIIDVSMGVISDARGLAAQLSELPGVVDHGLFIDLCDTVIVGRDGATDIRRRANR
jgi:ribose 5-phosphate isomerase A